MNNENFEPIPEIVENKEEDIEVLNIDENTPVTEENIIDINRLFETDEDIKIEKEEEEKEKKKDKLILKIQIGLIIFLVVSATLIYFFGYNIIEPLIKID